MTSDHLTNDQWTAIAPAVAKHFLGEPTRETDREIRWGRKYSKCLFKASGCLTDFENDPNRNLTVLEFVEVQCQTDRRGAIQWLKDNGHLPESPTRRTGRRFKRRSARPARQRAERPRAAQKPKPVAEKSDTQNFAQRLWAQSEPIGEDANHPFRRWTVSGDKPGVLHPYCAVPPAIRWSRYRGGVIVGGVFPLSNWGRDGIPKGKPVAVHALAIDGNGQNRDCLGKERNLRRCSYGMIKGGVFLIGDPAHQRVNIVEGVADALAVYSREPGAVLATLGTYKGLIDRAGVIDWLCTRQTFLYSDPDSAGDRGTAALVDVIKSRSPDAVVREPSPENRYAGDPADWAKDTPFPHIGQYDFTERSGIFHDSGVAWGEADRMAVLTFLGRQSNE